MPISSAYVADPVSAHQRGLRAGDFADCPWPSARSRLGFRRSGNLALWLTCGVMVFWPRPLSSPAVPKVVGAAIGLLTTEPRSQKLTVKLTARQNAVVSERGVGGSRGVSKTSRSAPISRRPCLQYATVCCAAAAGLLQVAVRHNLWPPFNISSRRQRATEPFGNRPYL
jgi:hypothetical protein